MSTSGCKGCGHLVCICEVRVTHEEGCLFRRAATLPFGLACDPHGRDVCPKCDPCTCVANQQEPASGLNSDDCTCRGVVS